MEEVDITFISVFHLENKHQTPFWSKVFIFINISAESEDALSQSELRERQIFHHTFCEPQTSKGLYTKWTKLDHNLIIINNIPESMHMESGYCH